jgi:hypothetical protein
MAGVPVLSGHSGVQHCDNGPGGLYSTGAGFVLA